MSGGDIAGLIAAGVFALLVLLLAVPILKLGKVFDEVRTTIRSLSDGATPLMDEVTATVSTTNQQLKKVDGISSKVQGIKPSRYLPLGSYKFNTASVSA